MGSDQALALVETDQATIARATFAIEDLQRIAVILCYQRWSVELAERYQENLQAVAAGLDVTRRWMSTIRSQL